MVVFAMVFGHAFGALPLILHNAHELLQETRIGISLGLRFPIAAWRYVRKSWTLEDVSGVPLGVLGRLWRDQGVSGKVFGRVVVLEREWGDFLTCFAWRVGLFNASWSLKDFLQDSGDV